MGTRLDRRAPFLTAGLLALTIGSLAPEWAAAADNPYGMDIHSPSGAQLTLIMDRLQAAGIGWAHVAVIWPYVETTRGNLDWRGYDEIVAAAQARNIRILATILYTPPWATTGPTWTGIPDTAAWMDFCSNAARRYQGAIDYWGVWNEPNSTEFWAGTRQQYIDLLLKPAADAIHAANPTAQVGGPALAHVTSADWYDWLDDVLLQAGDHLDFVTHHVYDTGGNRKVTSKLNDPTIFGDEPELWGVVPPSVREVLKHAGWFGKPFWLTETGWQSQPAGETLQATYYGGILSDWFTNFQGQTWIDKIFFYEMVDFPANGTTWGILHADGTPKPAYNVYRAFIAGAQPSSNDDAQLVASNLPKTIDAGQTIDVSLTFRNTGTSTWTSAASYKLGAVGNTDPFAAPRQLLAPSDAISPGQQKTFTFAFTAPSTPGPYATHWQMLREGVAWFGQELSQQVTVNAAPSPTARTLPLQGGRFAVTVSWHDPQSGNAGFGTALPGTDETGTFWFFSPANTELVIKVLDARAIDKHFWFFYGALSDVEYWITATDLLRGTTATYYNPPGNLCGKADTSTFGSRGAGSAAPAAATGSFDAGDALRLERASSGPHDGFDRWAAVHFPQPSASHGADRAEASAPTCVASSGDLCLLGDRFQVSVDWAAQGMTGTGMAAALSDQTGTFAFFDPQAIDLVVKVIDGRTLTGDFWFFYGALSNVAYTITLTDTVTGASKQYHNQQGNLCGLGDTSALN